MRILGIDTSLTGTGLARIDVVEIEDDDPLAAYNAVTATVAAPGPTKDKSKQAMCRRVNALIDQIEACFSEPGESPDAVGLEALAYGAKGASAWVLPWVFGRVIELTVEYQVPLTVVSTSGRAKFATGKGSGTGSDKDSVLLAAAKLFNGTDLRNNNEADAMIVGAVVCQRLGLPILPMTKYRNDVVEALED